MAKDGAATKPVSLWRGTDYGQWLVAGTCTSLSNSIQDFSLPIIARSITESPALATLIDSAIGFVRGALELPGGLLQDSVDRRRLMTIFGATGFVIFLTAAACAHVGVLGYAALVVVAVLLGIRGGLLGGAPPTRCSGVRRIWGRPLPALTLKGLITLPRPDQWQQHIKRCGLTTF